MPIGCTVWDMTNDKCFDFDEAKTIKKIVLKLQCQSCNHYSQHPIKVLSHFSYAKLNQVCHHLFYLNLSWLPVSQRCKHSEIIGDKKGKRTSVPSKINGMPWLRNAYLYCLITNDFMRGAASFFFPEHASQAAASP